MPFLGWSLTIRRSFFWFMGQYSSPQGMSLSLGMISLQNIRLISACIASVGSIVREKPYALAGQFLIDPLIDHVLHLLLLVDRDD